ncbi:MAG TPA: hypothetical protein VHB97_08910 [Polyangia bacterium]|nr:hypothetical protein [Polyangia bacterium]
MTRDDFEHRLLSLWMTTRMPLTRANLQFVTGVPRPKLAKWLDELVSDGVLDVDADDDGEMIWGVRGAARASTGPTKPEDVKKLSDLKQEVAGSSASSALALMKSGAGAAHSLVSAGEGKKSLVASGLLSFFFGPLGWLYAAPLREAVPAIVVYSLFWVLFAHFALFAPVFTLLHILFGAAGVGYALRHNQKGERTTLLPADSKRALPPRRP